MDGTPSQQAALHQLAEIPGVVGSMVFDAGGAVVASAFPTVFDPAGLVRLASQLWSDAYFQEWMAGEQGGLDLRFADGHVVVRSIGGAWLLVLCTLQSNAQLVAMSLTQVVRRLRITPAPPPRPAPPAPPPPPSPLERLRLLVSAELGAHSAQALEILAAAGTKPKELQRAAAEIEKLVRLFISKKKAEEMAARMRDLLAPGGGT
jgi:predicted regulator of Ras-like GTPase activity (Roadblock/LC7/MglB family)